MSGNFLVLYNWFLWEIAFIISFRKVVYYKRVGIDGCQANTRDRGSLYFLFILFLLYSLFTFFGGDRTTYESMVFDAAQYGNLSFVSMEPVYVVLSGIVRGNFLLWKLVVYGGSLLLVYFSMKRLGVDNIITLMLFSGICLISYGAARGVLAYAVYLFGLSLITKKHVYKVIVGWAIIISSYFFHHSMIPIIVMAPLVYLRLNKMIIVSLILLFPVVQLLFNSIIVSVYDSVELFSYEYEQELLQNKFRAYTNEDDTGNDSLPLHQIIQNLLDYAVYLPIIWFAFKLYFKRLLPRQFTSYLSIVFFVFYLAFLFRFSPLYNNAFLYRRFLGMVPFYLFVLAVPVFNNDKIKLNGLQLFLWAIFIKGNYYFALIVYRGIIS